ncbi:L-ornithine-N5-monooxygenase [Penicillium brevicompactum]|uniref:L-ornithine-N5-monooxygenase n=1 Tax=Penicillium brevicompactum TaxID=5074 RepID=A0A9W9QEK1_PENBR|nr:L-ornithine-N5-monooxygenase [Penicillium brevicompactum]
MTYRNKSLHDERRRIWSKAFGDPSIRSYEQRATVYQQKLMAHITGLKGKPVNITRLFHLFTFDVMGDFAFGKSFGLLDTQEFGITQLLRTALIPLGFSFPVWFLRVLVAIPGATKDWWKFMDFCAGRLKTRLDQQSSVKTADITSALSLPLAGKQPTKAEWDLLTGDAQLIVIAGSDTTASTLSAMIFELVKSPRHIEILRQEVAPYMQASGEVLNQDITHLEHLNAVINETLRLHPPVPTALQRKTPPEGITVGETYIPGNTTVICPQYVMGRSEEIYERASEFVPERWTTRPEMITENDVFVPFSSGPYGCIGKHLALSIIRTTISKIVTTFDLSLGPGEDGRRFERDAKESFVMSFGDLDICFEERVGLFVELLQQDMSALWIF